MDREALIHFVGGAVGGTAGTCITCPLEVIKTRMQSSKGITPAGPSTSQGSCRSGGSPPSIPRKTTPPQGPLSSTYRHFLENNRRLGMDFLGRLSAKNDVSRNAMSLDLARFVQSQVQEPSNAPRRRLNIIRYFS